MNTRKQRMTPILTTTLQTGCRISEQFWASTEAASFTQSMASLIYLQLHRINRTYRKDRPASTYRTTHQNCTSVSAFEQAAAVESGHPNQACH